MTADIEYRVNAATTDEIVAHLTECGGEFLVRLRLRGPLRAYAQKLFERAVRIEARREDRLIGLAAAYLDSDTALAFVTNVSVVPRERGAGLARALVVATIEYAAHAAMTRIDLEVDQDNAVARNLYSSLGFAEAGSTGHTVRMTRYIQTGEQQ